MALLSVSDLAVSFGGVRAVAGVSFDVEAGEIFTLIGPNGAGKTTVFNLISRIYSPSAGRMAFDGVDLTKTPPYRIAALGVARTFQNIELFENATVLDNLLIGHHAHGRSSLIGDLIFSPATRRSLREAREAAEEALELLRLQRYRHAGVGGLPYGVRKVVELARALCARPKLLLLDEPSSGLNAGETDAMAEWILQIRDRLAVTILVVEHDMSLVSRVSDRVAALNQGAVLALGTAAEVRDDPRVIEAYLGGGEDVESLRRPA